MSPLYRRIGAYEIRAEIGGGGMADVYVAEDARNGRTVALKVPRMDPDIRRAERDGALLQQHLAEKDSRVAQVYEAGEDEGVPFVAMEYVAGQDLSERIAAGPLEPREALRIAIELCDLLATAHACTPALGDRPRRGIVHGDLKPRNIRLEPDGRVRVVDFGIAKALSETRRVTHNDFGSLAYSSPERVDTGTVDAQADLWAVAVVLYEMLTGTPPFRAATPRQLEQILLGRTRPLPLPPHCPAALDAVLRKAFSPSMASRYAGAAAFKEDLERVLAGVPTDAEAERSREEITTRWSSDVTRRTGPATAPDGANGANAAAEDAGEITRRTTTVDEATRRSGTAGAGPVAAPGDATARTGPVPAPPSASTAPAARKARDLVALAKRVGLVLALAAVFNEVLVMRAASDLASTLPSYGRSEAGRIWTRYRGLRGRSLLRVGVWGLEGRLKNWHVAQADELTGDYLSDTPTIRERGWQQAVALLRRAATLAPGDSRVRARLRYGEGQLARINGEALVERGRPAEARARFNEAKRAFEEAVRLRGRWPDPWLGLARVQAVGFADVDQVSHALRQAERAGYALGDREVALSADAHRIRAERMWAVVPDLPDASRYLDRIREDCERALELYDEVPAYSQVSRNIRRVHALLARLDARESPFPDALSPVPGYEEPEEVSVDGIDFKFSFQ